MGQVLGGAVSGIGAQAQAKSAKWAAEYNQRMAKIEGAEGERFVRNTARREASNNITRIAKSGVRVEGSPLEVMASNAANEERQITNVRRGAFVKSEFARVAKKNAKIAGKIAVAGAAIDSAVGIVSLGTGVFGKGSPSGGGGNSQIGGQTFGYTGGADRGDSGINGNYSTWSREAFNRRYED